VPSPVCGRACHFPDYLSGAPRARQAKGLNNGKD